MELSFMSFVICFCFRRSTKDTLERISVKFLYYPGQGQKSYKIGGEQWGGRHHSQGLESFGWWEVGETDCERTNEIHLMDISQYRAI